VTPDETLVFMAEAVMLLPYMYACKLWQAHHEFMEDLLADAFR
jgi:hypothetical protein